MTDGSAVDLAPAEGADPLARAERARRMIAAAVAESWATIPHFAAAREVPADRLVERLGLLRATAPAVSITDLLLQATAHATGVDVVGLSVATDYGVVNISIPGALSSDPGTLSEHRRAAVDRARAGALKKVDVSPTAVTLSNLGTHGVHWFTGIIPLGNDLLVTTGAARSVWTGAGSESRFWVTANADHRVHDGAHVAGVLERFSNWCDDAREGGR